MTSCLRADKILKNGIILKDLGKKRNFSDGNGFYLTESLESAKKIFLLDNVTDPRVNF